MLKVECSRRSSRGVALIVTLIMLAVITFMATAFLVLSQRERNSVSTNTDQTTARFTADTALERAKAQLLAGVIAAGNDQNYDLMVPTNFFNPFGFDPGAVDSRTNVNYNYDKLGNPLSLANQQQNLANLLYDPRPPVYITDTKVTNDFRYYLDLNRNGYFEPSGRTPEIGANGLPVLNALLATNYFEAVGDPQWIGVLRYPERAHSADNPFESRWTYLVLPAGKTLDVNYLHNSALNRTAPLSVNDGYARNQGVGAWELNLAAFFADLNTNVWYADNGLTAAYYNYNRATSGNFNTGLAFDDARALLDWRYGRNYATLLPASVMFGNGAAAFYNDSVDQYSDGPFQYGVSLPVDNDSLNIAGAVPFSSWVGADNTNHFFTTQDFFDTKKTSVGFAGRLQGEGLSPQSYRRYTFYRMLAQLGTDSAPPVEDKVDLNYRNLVNGQVVPGMETNLIAWTPLDFFTNSAARMFEKLNLRDNYGNLITVTNIPIWAQATNFISNNLYTPAVHRVLQLAANIYDASGQTNGIFPSIYRPYFTSVVQGGTNRIIYISGYELVNAPNDTVTLSQFLGMPGDINELATQNGINIQTRTNLYGAPWVIGAKKGFPNLNQVAIQSVSQLTRKLLVYRPFIKNPVNDWAGFRGKQMFIVGVSNSLAVEVWNSYNTVYPRPLYIQADARMTVELTNDVGFRQIPITFNLGGPALGATNLPALALKNTRLTPPNMSANKQPWSQSFVVPLQADVPVLADSVQIGNSMVIANNPTAQWNSLPWDNLSDPHWGLNITNNLRCFVMDGGAGGRVVDYVQLSRLDSVRDLTQETLAGANKLDVWTPITNTAAYWASPVTPISQGVIEQIQISMGSVQTSAADWNDNGLPSGSKASSIAGFSAFMTSSTVTSNTIQAPFTPTSKFYQLTKWQANDPLVHYLSEDLTYLDGVTNAIITPPNSSTFPKVISGMYVLNDRFSPWGGYAPKTLWTDFGVDPQMYNTAMKDPLVMASDHWNFPTNKFPSVGWLGRVHRGTPWQTVYMKAADIMTADSTAWQKWSGSANLFLATNIAPIVDRQLFEVFTTALSDNASRGQLSINQTNLAAWSAVLSGLIVLTNDPVAAANFSPPVYGPIVISPAGIYTPGIGTLPPVAQIVEGINNARTNFLSQTFTNLGDFLATPELADFSPYLLTGNLQQVDAGGISDEVLERIPQQIMSLVTISHSPRFVVYAYGQTLRPANNSILTSGSFSGMCTNYQVTAETATRAVIRVEGAPKNPHVVVEQYNVLPPD